MSKNCKITIPNLEELKDGGTLPVSDFAMARGVSCSVLMDKEEPKKGERRGQVITCRTWLAHADKYKKPLVDNCGLTVYDVEPDRDSVGVRPVIRNARDGGFGIMVVDEEKYLSHDNGVPLYPQSKVAPGAIEDGLELALKIRGDERHLSESTLVCSRNNPDNVLPWIEYNGFWYVKVDNIDPTNFVKYSNGQDPLEMEERSGWFRLEPLRAHFISPTGPSDIVIDAAIAACPFGVSGAKGISAAGPVDTDKHRIGKFLHSVGMELKNSAARCIPQNAKTELDVVRAFRGVELENATLRDLTQGVEVKIKCEGRTGIVKAIDRTRGLATLSVGGKHLKYRLEDLSRT